MKKYLFLLFTIMSFTGFAQIEKPVKWIFSVEHVSERNYDLVIKADIQKGWNVYSQDVNPDGPIPTSFVFNESVDFKLIDQVKESQPITKYDPVFQMELSSFQNEAIFKQRIELLNDTLSIVKGELEFMACNSEMCLPPDYVDMLFDVKKKKDSLLASISNWFCGLFTSPEEVDCTKGNRYKIDSINLNEPVSECGEKIVTDSKSYWSFFLWGLLGGFIALLTPCIFPMIPLTVSFFTKGAENRSRAISRAILYGVFICLTYVLLSVPFYFASDPDVFNLISTDPILNTFFGVIFIAFAISFFGYFELTLPSSWTNRISAGSSLGGVLGIFFMALTLAIVSFSCTGPILGTLLAGSLSGDSGAWELTAGMGGFGLALGLPFALFAMFPNVLNKLPKSGGWLNTIKVTLGFIELALALKFLSNADLVAHWGILKIELFLALWFIIFFLLGIYLIGKIRFPKEVKLEKISGLRLLSAILAFGFSVYLASGLIYDKDKQSYNALSLLSGLAPPLGYSYFSPKDCPNDLDCFKDLKTGIEYAKKQGKPILLDFTGYACVNCRKMEEHVWPLPEVDKVLRDNFVLISLYVDDKKELPEFEQLYVKRTSGVGTRKLENYGHKWAHFQASYFGVNSQPFYLIMDPNTYQILNDPVGYMPDANEYISFLECGLSEFKSLKEK